MARSIDSDYIDFSQIGGFDMGIDFDGFEENMKKLMELPIKYLDSAHDKAVELIEDVQAILFAPVPDDELPNMDDQPSSNVMSGSSPVETGLVGQNADVSTPESLVTEENSSAVCVDMIAHETESFSTTENTSSKGSHIEANDLCRLPEGTSKTEIYDSCTSEEVILWNPEVSVKSSRPLGSTIISQDDNVSHAEQVGLHFSGHSGSSVCSNGAILLENPSANYEEKMVLYSGSDPVGATMQEPTTVSQDYVHQALDTDQGTDQAGLHCSEHSEILVESAVFFGAVSLEDSSAKYEEQLVLYGTNCPVEATTHGDSIPHDSADVFSCADDPNVSTEDMVKFVNIDPKNGQEHTKNDKTEDFPVPQRENASFKKMFMRSLSSKLRWSKKQTNAQALAFESQDPENLGYQLVSSSDDLEDDWEVL